MEELIVRFDLQIVCFLSATLKRQVGSASGYPVFSRTGNAGQKWLMGEVDLDREYTSHPFHVSHRLTGGIHVVILQIENTILQTLHIKWQRASTSI